MWCPIAITMLVSVAMADLSSGLVVLGQPFMQRALLGGLLTGALGGLLGSFAVLRQLSFFSDALGHSALLGISLGILLGVNPTLVLIPFAVLFALLVNQLVARSGLPADALLNIVYSTSLAFAVVALSLVETYRGGIQQLLFGDILGISWSDLTVIAVLLLAALGYLALSLRAQVLLTLNNDLAGAFGVGANRHRLIFIVLLAVVVAVSIKAVGVLLISAFVVIPACAGRLVSRHFPLYALVSASLGGGCALLGLLGSGLTNLPSGPCVVIVQFAGFLLALIVSQQTSRSPAVAVPAGPRIPGAGPAAPESR
jgi:zinc/manganese transport system permease protein